jgi:BTB/POZ domain
MQYNGYVDVEFEVDDGFVQAHRIFLVTRCEVMAGMFTNNFLESSTKLVSHSLWFSVVSFILRLVSVVRAQTLAWSWLEACSSCSTIIGTFVNFFHIYYCSIIELLFSFEIQWKFYYQWKSHRWTCILSSSLKNSLIIYTTDWICINYWPGRCHMELLYWQYKLLIVSHESARWKFLTDWNQNLLRHVTWIKHGSCLFDMVLL